MDSKKILIVDDEINILNSLKRSLETTYHVDTALGAQEAVTTLSKNDNKYDVILCDFMMPGMNGAEFYDYVSLTYPGLEKRIAFMTGGTYAADIKTFFDKHTNPCLPKPFPHEDLLALIENMLRVQ